MTNFSEPGVEILKSLGPTANNVQSPEDVGSAMFANERQAAHIIKQKSHEKKK